MMKKYSEYKEFFSKAIATTTLFCDVCGDIVKVVYPCKFVFHDDLTVNFNVCLECMQHGELRIDLPRKRLVSTTLKALKIERRNVNVKTG